MLQQGTALCPARAGVAAMLCALPFAEGRGEKKPHVVLRASLPWPELSPQQYYGM